MKNIPRSTLLVIVLLSLTGAITIAFSTRWGPWAYSDSTAYIVSARTFLEEGRLGYYVPSGGFERLTHHPPLYPLILSAIGLPGVGLLAAARWLNVILFGATIGATGVFTYRLLRSSWLAIILSAVMLTIPPLVDLFSGAMSEPLFIFTSVVGTFLALFFLETQQRRYLILAASAAGMAFLTRYIGVFAIAAGLVILLIFNRSPWKARLKDLVLYGLVSLVPNAAWWLYVYLSTTSYAARQVISRADLGSALIELRLLLMEVFWSWLPFTQRFTYSYNLALKVWLTLGLISLLPLGLVIWKLHQDRQRFMEYRPEINFLLSWCIFSLAYLGFLVYAYLFTTPTPDVNQRILLTGQIGFLLVLLSAVQLVLRVLRSPAWGSLVVTGLVLVYIFAHLPASLKLVRDYNQHGAGYTSITWQQSTTLAVLNQLPAEMPIITNQAAAVLLWTDRPPYDFCQLPCSQPEGVRYGDNPADETQRIFREQGAALVLFYPFCASQVEPWNLKPMTQVEALTRDLTVYHYSCNGAIYFYP
ncbi:MAG TPA: glycosyltransferase family 39 protein [Anaerolineales bacterium]|nr:glycosyltransferase family 39 protein [Anaerolineales bacterium]